MGLYCDHNQVGGNGLLLFSVGLFLGEPTIQTLCFGKPLPDPAATAQKRQ